MVPLHTADDKTIDSKYFKTLPEELQISFLYPPLTKHTLTHIDDRMKPEYQHLGRRQLADTIIRPNFYVDHILVSLHFWDIGLIQDLVAFEIGRFRKKPELIFNIDHTDWGKSLICVQYITRNNPQVKDAFIEKFQRALKDFTSAQYHNFLPYEFFDSYHGELHFSYQRSGFLVQPYPNN